MGQFQMQSFHKGVWSPMEDGPAKSVWKPRSSAIEAAVKCLTWTGLICIPAMRVVDLESGDVVWSDTSQYPEAGASLAPDWDAGARSAALAELVGGDTVADYDDPEPALFDLAAMDVEVAS